MSLSNSGGYAMTPADYAAMNGNFGGNGWGLGGNRGGCNTGCGSGCATTADVDRAVNQQTTIGKLDGITQGICDATYALNNTVNNGFSQAELSRCNGQAALMQQLYNMSAQNQACCCETQRAIERASCDTNYNLAAQGTAIQNAICNSTRDIIDNNNQNSRAILDFLTQQKIDQLREENSALRLKASQSDQNAVLRAAIDASTAEIIRRTGNDCPIPAYVVPNPNCCYGNPVGVSYGYNNGGCGCNSCC